VILTIATHFSAAWSVCCLSSVAFVHLHKLFDGFKRHLAAFGS